MGFGEWRKIFFAGVSALTLSACGASDGAVVGDAEAVVAPVKLETPPAGQLPEGVAPTAYRLDLEVDPSANRFSGAVEIDVALAQPHLRIWLHALGPDVGSVVARLPDGRTIDGAFEGGLAEGGVSKIDFEEPIPAGDATLVMAYEAPYNRLLAGLYKTSQGGEDYLATQMEPIDARRMLPSFDEPRFKTPWTVSVTAPADDVVVANGALIARETLSDGRVRHRFATTRPIQTYLLALVVGPFDEVVWEPLAANEIRSAPVPFRGFAAMGKGPKLETALETTEALLQYQEAYFDFAYPYTKLDLIAAPAFAFGAMENAGAIIYREARLLIDDRTPLAARRATLATHAHELAHQWFGNLVTPKWWDDIWLNEAFATWMSYKTMAAYDPEGGYDRAVTRRALGAMAADSLASARQIRNPIERNADILDAFDSITYSKGGGVLSMFEAFLGEAAFREGIRLHMQRFTDGVADVDDFMASLAEGSGRPEVVEAFRSFIFQPGIPYLNVTATCSEAGEGALTVAQSRYAPLGSRIDPSVKWTIPFSARLGRDGESETVQALLTERETTLPLEEGCVDWVLPNADGSGYWRFNLEPTGWSALTNAFETLTAREQLVFGDSVAAAFRAGDMPAERWLAATARTSTGSWDAATQPLSDIQAMADLLPDERRGAMQAWAADTYGPLYQSLVELEDEVDDGQALLRGRLKGFMATAAADPDLRADLSSRAAAYVGLNGEPDANALSPSEVSSAVAVAAADLGPDFYAAAKAYALASDDQTERLSVFVALVGAAGAADVEDLMIEALSDAISPDETYRIFTGALGNAGARSAAWAIFRDNFDEMAAKVPQIRQPRLGAAVGSFCDADLGAAAEAFIRTKADLIPGYERSLAQGGERAALCATLKAEKGAELADALSALEN